MTDFVRDLDEQLVAASRRRAERRARRRFTPPMPAGRLVPVLPGRGAMALGGRLVPALAGFAAIVAAVLGVAALQDGGALPDERIAGPTPPAADITWTLTLPSPGAITTCQDEPLGRPVPSGGRPAQLLGVLRRPRTARDEPPRLRLRDGRMLLPITTYDPAEVRRAGRSTWIVPTAGIAATDCSAERDGAPRGPGACLVSVIGAFVSAHCWTLQEIESGRAFAMVTPRDEVAGIVPDGVLSVEGRRRGSGALVRERVRGNVAALRVPGARRGVRVHLRLRRSDAPIVAFFNATTVPGGAQTAADRLRATGYPFVVDAIGNAPEQAAGRSTVYGTGTNGSAAVEVARRLDVTDIQASPDPIRALAPRAHVIVVVGMDLVGGEGWTEYGPPIEDREGYQPPAEHKGGGQ